MMDKLWQWSLQLGTIFLALCLMMMFWYSANKSVVTIEEYDQRGRENLSGLTGEILAGKEKYNFIVIVNPAHGGRNLGNVVDDLQEKDITLAVGRFLEELARGSDIGIFVIRKKDQDISTESRAQLIAEVQPDILLDLHVNADPDNERTFGTSVMYNENFYAKKMTNAQLADIVERQLVKEISGKANGIFPDQEKKHPLLHMSQVPGVSIEMGYLTNGEEASLLRKEDYQRKLARGLYEGILQVREEMSRR